MPKLGLNPEQPHRVDGDEIDPSVSDPSANPTHPAATALAEPADDPLEPKRRIPRIPRTPAKPLIAHGQRAQ